MPLPGATSACAVSSSDVVWMAIGPPRLVSFRHYRRPGTGADTKAELGGRMASRKSKTTFNKIARDRELRERRELKREKKKAAKIAKALGVQPPQPPPEEA